MRFCQIRAVVTTGGEWHVFPFHALCSYHGGRSLLRLKKIEFRLRHWCFYLLWIYKIWLRYVPSPSDQIFLPCSICPPLKSASNQIRSVWRTLYGPFNTHSLPSIRLTLASVHVGGFYFIPFHQKFLFWDVGLRWIVEFHQFFGGFGVFIRGFITLQLHHDATGRMVRHDDTERTLKWSFSNLSVVLNLCRRCCKQFFVPVWLINGFFLPKSDREIVISSIISVSIERPESTLPLRFEIIHYI